MSREPGPAPLVSIILPVRNTGRFLEECLDSIRVQTLDDFEVIAVDDGSTDQSGEILFEASKREARIRFLTPGRVGIVSAMNLALKEASGRFVARMDSDDVMRPERLERQAAFLDRNDSVALVSSRVEAFPEANVAKGLREYLRWQDGCLTPSEIANNLYVESPFVHPTVMWRRGVVQGLGGYRDGDFPEDYDLWLRMNAAGLKMAKMPAVLLRWRERRDRLSRRDRRYGREAFDRLRVLSVPGSRHSERSVATFLGGWTKDAAAVAGAIRARARSRGMDRHRSTQDRPVGRGTAGTPACLPSRIRGAALRSRLRHEPRRERAGDRISARGRVSVAGRFPSLRTLEHAEYHAFFDGRACDFL